MAKFRLLRQNAVAPEAAVQAFHEAQRQLLVFVVVQVHSSLLSGCQGFVRRRSFCGREAEFEVRMASAHAPESNVKKNLITVSSSLAEPEERAIVCKLALARSWRSRRSRVTVEYQSARAVVKVLPTLTHKEGGRKTLKEGGTRATSANRTDNGGGVQWAVPVLSTLAPESCSRTNGEGQLARVHASYVHTSRRCRRSCPSQLRSVARWWAVGALAGSRCWWLERTRQPSLRSTGALADDVAEVCLWQAMVPFVVSLLRVTDQPV